MLQSGISVGNDVVQTQNVSQLINQGAKPWIKTIIRFIQKAVEMSFVLIIAIVWIMPLKIAGNIGPVRIVSKNESEKCPQTFCCHRLTQISITRFHHR